jgi:hypothetical protein
MGPNKATRLDGASGFRNDITSINGFSDNKDHHLLKIPNSVVASGFEISVRVPFVIGFISHA